MPEKSVKVNCMNVNCRSLWSESGGPAQADVVLLVAGANAPAPMWPDEFVELLISNGYRVNR